MDLNLLIQICSWPLLIVGGLLSLGLTMFAIVLTTSSKNEDLIRAYLPLTFLPVIAGLCSTMVRTLSSIGMQLSPDTEVAVDPAFLIQMNLVPLLFGFLMAVPPAFVTALGGWRVAWRNNGGKLRSHRTKNKAKDSSTTNDAEFAKARETVDYIDTLVKPR